MPAAFAAAHDGLAMELKTDLPESGRARLFRSMGKRTGGSETDKSEFPDSIGDIGPVPCSQATMVEYATSNALGATDRIDRGTGASFALTQFACNHSTNSGQVCGCRTTTFSDRMRRP